MIREVIAQRVSQPVSAGSVQMEVREVPAAVATSDVISSTLTRHQPEMRLHDDVVVVFYRAVLLGKKEKEYKLIFFGMPRLTDLNHSNPENLIQE